MLEKEVTSIRLNSLKYIEFGKDVYAIAKGNDGMYYVSPQSNDSNKFILGPSFSTDTDLHNHNRFINDNLGKWERVDKPGCGFILRYPFSYRIEVVEPPKSAS